MKFLLPPLALSLALATAAFSATGTPTPDKSSYTLFNPTPRTALRELSTDRPDQTESPYTVDAGHWQFELDLLSFTRDRDRATDTRTETWDVAPLNLKLGLCNTADLQLMIDPYTRERVKDPLGTTTSTTRWESLTVRLKINLWGNDGGDTALAIMPFVKTPLRNRTGNNRTEGGIIVPLALALPGGYGLGLMTELDILANTSGNGRHGEWINTVTVSRDLTEKLGGYLELVSNHSAERGAKWVAQFDAGLTFAISADVQLDAGCNFGLTRSAPDVQPFLGLSLRY